MGGIYCYRRTYIDYDRVRDKEDGSMTCELPLWMAPVVIELFMLQLASILPDRYPSAPMHQKVRYSTMLLSRVPGRFRRTGEVLDMYEACTPVHKVLRSGVY